MHTKNLPITGAMVPSGSYAQFNSKTFKKIEKGLGRPAEAMSKFINRIFVQL